MHARPAPQPAGGAAAGPATSGRLLDDFGPSSPLARSLLRALWDALESGGNAREQGVTAGEVIAGGPDASAGGPDAQWAALFGRPSLARLSRARLGGHFRRCGLPEDADPARALFVLHTYCAILFEGLAIEVLARSGSGPGAALDDQGSFAQSTAAGGARAGRTPYDWYARAPSPALAEALRALARRLTTYVPPAEPQDVVHELYHGLVPKVLRHGIGEFYTPRWMAEHLLDAAGYHGERVLEGALLDPTCGAGGFLVLAIARYRVAARRARWTREATLRGVLAAIGGFDLNPLAVLGARLNVLLALSDLLDGASPLTLPVEVADALAPARERQGVPGGAAAARWVVGNPPWVRWSELPAAYRERVKPTCERYAIFSRTPFFGGNELDISAVVLYAAADKWLAPGGTLAFIIPQTHLQVPSSQGFRAFVLPDGTPLGVSAVHDWTLVRPFPGVANKPASLVATKGAVTPPSVPYRLWRRRAGGRVAAADPWRTAARALEHEERQAAPLESDGRWAVATPAARAALARIGGEDHHHRGRKGITCDLNAAYFVSVLASGAPGILTVRTDTSRARTALPVRTFEVEAELVHPLLKGAADFSAFRVRPPALCVVVPNRTISGIDPQAFAGRYPRALAHFAALRPALEGRSSYRTRLRPTGAPFYAIYNVGPYTFAPYKVVWAEMASRLRAAVVASAEVPGVGARVVVPDHKIYFVACEERDQAHYLCALLNSPPVRSAIDSFTVKLQVGSLFRHVRLPRFDPSLSSHRELAALSLAAHAGGGQADERELERLARDVLGIA